MPSSRAWTIGWAGYFGWMMYETYQTRFLDGGYRPIYTLQAYKLKEKYLRSKKLLEKYDEELDSVNAEDLTFDDAAKFQLDTPTAAVSLWNHMQKHPYWKEVDREVRAEVRQAMVEEHPEYGRLLQAEQAGGVKGVFMLDGPWMSSHHDDGLQGHFQSYTVRSAHH
eukprot:NODE_5730_length_643_cov_175.255892_g5341_i0.p1 GENE.NODE_5730_length_643_cov_175.255892_g5341_i0~~NODE_5730_length_643_cov_175.255892_g5341_i0.p1  ORF type:complete len:166 (-),score=22.32 NODE_5730_length_643_cov_175.255892_g5341_i0:91-588(-)